MKVLIATHLSFRPKPSTRIYAALSAFILVLITVGVWQGWFGEGEQWIATRHLVFQQHQYWRLFSATLVHSDMEHLTSNLLSYGVLSFLLMGYFSFYIFPLAAFIFGALANALTLLTYPPDVGLLGVSGVIYWMAGFWLVLFSAIDRRYLIGGRLLRAVGFAMVIFVPTSYRPDVAYLVHAVGFILGALFGAIYFWRHRHFFRRAEQYYDEAEEMKSLSE